MLCTIIYQTSQQIDISVVYIILPIIISVVGTVIAFVAVKENKKQFERDNMDKLATKDYVNYKIKVVNDKIEENKKDNKDQHDNIQKNYQTELSYIKIFLEDIKKDLIFLKNSKAS